MNERERLIELLNNAKKYATNPMLLYLNIVEATDVSYEGLQADYLLKNGVIVLPIKVEQTVYYIFDGFIEPCTVEVIFLSDYEDKDGNCTYKADIHFDRADCPYTEAEIYFTDIGKTIFLTKQEAEKALKGGAK